MISINQASVEVFQLYTAGDLGDANVYTLIARSCLYVCIQVGETVLSSQR